MVHTELSSHTLLLLLVCTQPVPVLQLSSVHALLSLQSLGEPLVQTPPEQTSLTVHAFPSLHVLVLSANTQVPLPASVQQVGGEAGADGVERLCLEHL